MSQEFEHFDYIGSNEKNYDYFLSSGKDGTEGQGIVEVAAKHDAEEAEFIGEDTLPATVSVELYANPGLERFLNRFPGIGEGPYFHDREYDMNEDGVEMLEDIAASHGVEPYPHDTEEDGASYEELAEDQYSMLPRILDAIEADGKTCAVMIAIDYAQYYGRGPVLPDDPDALRIVYTAVDPITHRDGLTDKERDKLMSDSDNIAGVASIDIEHLRVLGGPMANLDSPEAQHALLCDLVTNASHNPVVLPIRHYDKDLSVSVDQDVLSREPEALDGIVDTSKFIGSYNSLDEMLLDNLGKFPVVDRMAEVKAAKEPIFRAKLEHKKTQDRPAPTVMREPVSRKQNDIER